MIDAPSPRLAPPHKLYPGFLPEDECAALLASAIASHAAFAPTKITTGLDLALRVSSGLQNFGALQESFQARAKRCLPEWLAALGVPAFTPRAIELGMVAHGDGAFFAPHSDLLRDGETTGPSVRILSAVYYFHKEPKGFTGGELRLQYIDATGPGARSVSIVPENNLLVIFPSWLTHEVTRVSCPSGAFDASRFSINCWIHRATTSASHSGEPG